MLLRMVEEERGVAVVRNDSNNEPTSYIPTKETLNPTTEQRTDHQPTHHRPTLPSEVQPRSQQ